MLHSYGIYKSPIQRNLQNMKILDIVILQLLRLGAINSILDRTGYRTTHKVEDVTGKKSDEELQTELNHLLSSIMVDKKDIN